MTKRHLSSRVEINNYYLALEKTKCYFCAKLTMKKYFTFLILALLLVSCESDDQKMQKFVQMYNNSASLVNTPQVQSTKAFVRGNDIVIDVYTKISEDEVEGELLQKVYPDLIGQLINSEPKGKELLEKDVVFKLNVFDAKGQPITRSEVNKETVKKAPQVDMKNFGSGAKSNPEGLKQMLEVFNKSLPITDKSSGVTILKIDVDAKNNLVYTAEVPENLKNLFLIEGSEALVKKELVKSPQIKDVLKQGRVFGINELHYDYVDKNKKLLKTIVISENDLRTNAQ